MKKIVISGPQRAEVIEVPDPSPGRTGPSSRYT